MRFGLRTVMIAMCLVAGGTAVVFHYWARRLREERETKLGRLNAELQRVSAELKRLKDALEFDAALVTAKRLRQLAEEVGDQEQIRRAGADLDSLEKESGRVVQMHEQARDLEREGKYRGACDLCEELHRNLPWREAEFPFAIFAEPGGVRIYKDRDTEPRWTSPATGEPIVLHLAYRCPRFALRFEKEGYRTKALDRLDERVGEVRVRLDPGRPR